MAETISFLLQNNKVQGLLELARPIKRGKAILRGKLVPKLLQVYWKILATTHTPSTKSNNKTQAS